MTTTDYLALALRDEQKSPSDLRDTLRDKSSYSSGIAHSVTESSLFAGTSRDLKSRIVTKLRTSGNGRAARRIEDCGHLPQGGKTLSSSYGRCGSRHCPTCSTAKQSRESRNTNQAMTWMVNAPITFTIKYESAWSSLGDTLKRAQTLRSKLRRSPALKSCNGGIITTQVAVTAQRVLDVHLHVILDIDHGELSLDDLSDWIIKATCGRARLAVDPDDMHVVTSDDLSRYMHRAEILEYIDDLSGAALAAVQASLRGTRAATRWGTGLTPRRITELPMTSYRVLMTRLWKSGAYARTDDRGVMLVQLTDYLSSRAVAPSGSSLRSWWMSRVGDDDDATTRLLDGLHDVRLSRADARVSRSVRAILEGMSADYDFRSQVGSTSRTLCTT